MRGIGFRDDSSETRRTPGRESRGGTVAAPNYRFLERKVCRRTLCAGRKILSKPLCGVVNLALTSFDFRFQQIARCLTDHHVETNTDEDHHQHNRHDTNQKVRHQKTIAYSPDKFSNEWPDQCDAKQNKKDDEENRKEIAADQRVASDREPDPVQDDRREQNQRDPLQPIESREYRHGGELITEPGAKGSRKTLEIGRFLPRMRQESSNFRNFS